MVLRKLKYGFKVVSLIMVFLFLMSAFENEYSLSSCSNGGENSCCCSEYDAMSSCSSPVTKIQVTKKCVCEESDLNEQQRDNQYLNISSKSPLINTFVNSVINYSNHTFSETIIAKKDFPDNDIDQKIFISFQNLRI